MRGNYGWVFVWMIGQADVKHGVDLCAIVECNMSYL